MGANTERCSPAFTAQLIAHIDSFYGELAAAGNVVDQKNRGRNKKSSGMDSESESLARAVGRYAGRPAELQFIHEVLAGLGKMKVVSVVIVLLFCKCILIVDYIYVIGGIEYRLHCVRRRTF